MKYLVGLKQELFSGYSEKEVDATEFIIDERTHVLYFYNGVIPVAAFHQWEYVEVKNEEA